ncbi:MAG: hypothetical protein ACREFP_14670 [Acetobacteraceae bacterium]
MTRTARAVECRCGMRRAIDGSAGITTAFNEPLSRIAPRAVFADAAAGATLLTSGRRPRGLGGAIRTTFRG